MPQRGQELREEGRSFHAAARRLRVFDLEVFFFGTAIVNLREWAQLYLPSLRIQADLVPKTGAYLQHILSVSGASELATQIQEAT